MFLKEGDVIKLKEGYTVGVMIPEHFVFSNKKGCWRLSYEFVTIGDPRTSGGLDTSYLVGKYIVVRTALDGGGTGHGPGDAYPDGHHVYCERVSVDGESKIEVDFYQSGSFVHLIKEYEISPIGKAKKRWVVEEEDS